MKQVPKWLIWAFLIISFIGFIDATYLTVAHYKGSSLSCGLTGGCDKVTNSEFSKIFGIPIALGGSLYYLTIFLLSVAYIDSKKRKILTIIPPLTAIGFLASLYFVYLQIFVIEAICQYCMLSAITSTTLFVLSFFLLKYNKQFK